MLKQYDYDQYGRLTRATQPGHRIEEEGRQQFDNRPVQDSRWSYEYDAWGNLVKKHSETVTHVYHYDLLHRLSGYEKQTPVGTVTKASYHYDPFGR